MPRLRSLAILLTVAAVGVTTYDAVSSTGEAAPTVASARHAAAVKRVTVLKTHTSSLGKIVTGSNGRAVYVYDRDHHGTKKSACTGACRRAWPLVTYKGTSKTKVKVSGVTGKVGSIPATKGRRQVTLNGWPLYYFVGDASAGQTTGQGSGGIWWVVSPKGTHIKTRPKTPTTRHSTAPTPKPTPASPAPTSAAPTSPSPTTSTTPPAPSIDLGIGSSSLGEIVVNGHGLTVYVYDADAPGATTSACTGSCRAAWPPALVTGTPTVAGVTGTVGTIAASGGAKQLTLNGHPLYTYVGDGAPGDVGGEGIGNVWWAVAADGTKAPY